MYNNPVNKGELNPYFFYWIKEAKLLFQGEDSHSSKQSIESEGVKLLFRNEATHSRITICWIRGGQTLILGW
jgi:hypothetical protein